MYQFELKNPYIDSDEKKIITVPEEMSIADFTREIRCEMGLEYTTGTLFHMIIDREHRVFMDDDYIAMHVDMLWEGGDDPNDLEKKSPIYQESFYHPESKYTLKDLFPEVGADILYGQDYDKVWCTLIGIIKEDEE